LIVVIIQYLTQFEMATLSTAINWLMAGGFR